MITFAAVLVCVLLAAMAVFQLMLALGAPLGRFAWGGQHEVLPTRFRIGSAVGILLYVLIAWIVLARADVVSPGARDGFVTAAVWVVVAYLLIGVVMNAASRSKPERAVMTPLTAILCVLCVVVATS